MASTDSRNAIHAKVALGSNKILGIGSWRIEGVSTDLLDNTEFGDTWKQYLNGLKDGGNVTFSGLYKPEDTNGQDDIRDALNNNTQLTDLRFYIDTNSYWKPATTGPSSYIMITAAPISAEKGQLLTSEFTGKISGKMILV